jgi:arylsulfatase A-like enzyme
LSSPINQPVHAERIEKPGIIPSLASYALLGAGAVLLLGLIELVDVNIQLSPVFESFTERLVLSTYLSMNLAVGAVIGLIVGISARSGSILKRGVCELLLRGRKANITLRAASWLLVCGLSALLLNQQAHVRGYSKGLIRELEKLAIIRHPLLNHERVASYLLVGGMVAVCSLVWMIARTSKSLKRPLKTLWLLCLIGLMAAGYGIDSRVEVQLYEHSLHHSMFLLNLTVSMALVASVYLSSPRIRSHFARVRGRRALFVIALAILAGSLVFTLLKFGDNQNLKTQVFFRTTQAKQYFKLAQWALDFDRDGYSSVLGGGDADDSRADINPGRPEILGDGLDNNGIGGDLTAHDLDDWKRERASLHITDPSAQRLNVIYIFIDALRADHLGTYGYPRNTSPNIDRLAARSTVFENAFTPAPNTFEALPKFMQSSHWDGHYPTWTEMLGRNGYRNLLFPRRVATEKRHIKGMKIVHHSGGKGLNATIDAAIDVLGRTPPDRAFCAYLYATDPHRPYVRHDDFNFGASTTDGYDGEIAYTDSLFGRLFDWLEQSGRLSNTMIVFMADHGESLGERGVYKHSSQLYNEQEHIPMIIYSPGLAPRRVTDYVSSIDLGTTILSAVGIEPPKEYAGVSLGPLMRGEPFAHPPVYAEQTYNQDSPFVRLDQNVFPESKKYMVITQDGYKLIYNRNSYTFELFDLNHDKQELRNLFDRLPQKAEELKRLLGRFIDIVSVSRPWDADERQYIFGKAVDEDEEM